MDSHESLYRVTVSSSGLIFAVIVGAWAAYLVPMWLRRQDELNEARPTERFSTALRLLTRGRLGAAAARDDGPAADEARPDADGDEGATATPDFSADVRAYAEPVTMPPAPVPSPKSAKSPKASGGSRPVKPPETGKPAQISAARAKVLARRRRTTMVLFLAFTLGGVFALSSGPGLLWLPAIPAALLLAYVIHVRRQEHRRYAVALDRRRAEEAARRLRERAQASAAARPAEAEREQPARAVVEQTDHAEWVDQQRRPGTAPTWDPAPVPLPTYVNAPVAPRRTRGGGPSTWSPDRSTTAGSQPSAPAEPPRSTPLFDQYADDDHPRAAGE
jgi:hypothetical protein